MTAPTPELRQRVVLMVDDEDDIRTALVAILEEWGNGLRCVTAKDGLDAIEQMRGGLRPDVILLDLMMPRMNGWQFLSMKQRDPELVKIPVIVVSGSANASTIAPSLNVAEFLAKPVSLDRLLVTIRKWTEV